MGLVHQQIPEYEASLPYFEQALALLPGDFQVHHNLLVSVYWLVETVRICHWEVMVVMRLV